MRKESLISVLIIACSLLFAFRPARADDAYQQLLGTWTCTSDAGSLVQQTYALSDDGKWLEMRAKWNNDRARAAGYFQNYFIHDASSGAWNTVSYGSNGWAWAGRSTGLKNNQLVFDGIEETNAGAIITRETLTLRQDGKVEHLWEMRNNGVYQRTSHAICSRDADQ
jgi:hypothetical protein